MYLAVAIEFVAGIGTGDKLGDFREIITSESRIRKAGASRPRLFLVEVRDGKSDGTRFFGRARAYGHGHSSSEKC